MGAYSEWLCVSIEYAPTHRILDCQDGWDHYVIDLSKKINNEIHEKVEGWSKLGYQKWSNLGCYSDTIF